MSQIQDRGADALIYEEAGIRLVDDPERCAKIEAGKLAVRPGRRGVLRVYGDRMEWQHGSHEPITLRGVTAVEPGPGIYVRLRVEDADGPRTVFVSHVLSEGENPTVEKLALQLRLHTALEGAGGHGSESTEAIATLRQVGARRAEVALKRGRVHMGLGGAMFVIGLVITLATYGAADPGGTYTVMWGAMVFGLLWFIAGVVEYVKASGGSAR
jgi:hypothetical protein